jgi:hypothetical protein
VTLPNSPAAVAPPDVHAPEASAPIACECWNPCVPDRSACSARVVDGHRIPDDDATTTHVVKHEPGNGTSYRLVVVLEGTNIKLIAWPDVFWSAGDFADHVTAEWLANSAARGRKRGEAAFGRVDAAEIALVVNTLVDRKRRGELA